LDSRDFTVFEVVYLQENKKKAEAEGKNCGNFFMLSQGKKREKEEKKGRKRREEREEKKRERKERREERKERKKERRKKKEREKEEEKKEGKERRKDKTLVTKNLFGGSNVECDIFLKKFMPK